MIAPAGRKLGKYEIRSKLGRGGMADVYLADDTEAGYTVALKLVEQSADQGTQETIEAERRGAELQARLAEVDQRVVRVFAIGDLDGYFYVAMEYIDGQDLSELMRKGPLAPDLAADTAVAVAETLEHAHTLTASLGGKNFQGIVHGDIKPTNIRIDARGQVRVLDFGIAKALSLSRRLTKNEFGSVPYASPERLDSGEVDAQSDLWALAVMVYEMVTGLKPYHAGTTERLEHMVRSRIPPPPAPDPCPEPLRRILVKALAPYAEMRYASAREFADDLIAYRLGAPIKAASEDLDATRRTVRREGRDTDETRRTPPSQGQSEETRRTAATPAAVPATVKARRPAAFSRVMRVVVGLALASLLFGGYSLVSDYVHYKRGQTLARDIESEQLTDLNTMWNRWTELSGGNPSSLLLRTPRKAVKQKLVEDADHVIAAYRTGDGRPVFEKRWEEARVDLTRALAAEPDDAVRGRLRLVEGHIARINGNAHSDAAQYNLAVEKFTEAEHLMPRSADPELGLARVYVYGLKDIDRAYAALQEAERRGFALGNRERLQLADGYRERADRLWWDSRNVRGLPQERDQIVRSKQDYERSRDLYSAIAPFGNSTALLTRVAQSLESVNSRLGQIDGATDSADPLGKNGILGTVLRKVEGALSKAAGEKSTTH